MLFEKWRQIAEAYRDELALLDVASQARWTFGELAYLVEQGVSKHQTMVCPSGNGPDFIIDVLRGWRSNSVLCPLEPGQPAPPLNGSLPPGIVHLKLTSATTDRPRLVAFTASQLMADVDNIVQTMGLRRDWPNAGIISLAHSYGFSNLVLPLLLHGVPLLLLGSALPESLRGAAALAPEITLAAVPALWRAWSDANSIPRNVGLAISAGAPLPLTLEQEVFTKTQLKIHNFYGSSECGGIAYDTTDQPRSSADCAGTALHNVTLSIASNGCLTVRSDAVGQTYWPEPLSGIRDGTFYTSDLAEICNGLVHLRGRLSDQINVAGRKVSPEAIESVLITHPHVQDCLVFGVPSSELNRAEQIVACVVPKRGISTDDLRQFLLSRLPAWQVPRQWRFLESLAPNKRGKRSRAEWRKTFLSSLEPTS